MIDTIRIEIRLEQWEIEKIKMFLCTQLKIQNSTGEEIRSFCIGSLLASWDSRISVKIKNERFISTDLIIPSIILRHHELWGPDKTHEIKRKKKIPIAVSCPEYVEIEFSLGKWATGVNFLNSSMCQDAVRISVFRQWLSGLCGFVFPTIDKWIVHRVDIGYNYFIGTDALVEEQLSCYKNLNYPKRKPIIYKTSVYFSGYTTTVKLYSKGPEFLEHDKKRFKKFLEKDALDYLCSRASGILRYEVEFHSKKLDQLGLVYLDEILNYKNWGDLMKSELKRLLSGATSTKIYTINEVREKLYDGYYDGQGVSADVCLGVWLAVSMQGKKIAKEIYGRNKLYRALQVLEDLGISCVTNIHESVQPDLPVMDLLDFSYTDQDKLLNAEICQLLPFDHAPLERYQRLPIPNFIRARAA